MNTEVILAIIAIVAVPVTSWLSSKLTKGKYTAEIAKLQADVTAANADAELKEHEAESKGISTANEMIELVKKAYKEAGAEYKLIAEGSKKDNEKLRKHLARFEKALKAISLCDYRHQCPVTDRLQSGENAVEHKQ